MTSALWISEKSPPWRYRAANHPHIVPVRAFDDNYIWLGGLDNAVHHRFRG